MAGLLTFLAGPIGRWLLMGLMSAAVVLGVFYKIKSLGYEDRVAEEALEDAAADKRAAERADTRKKISDRIVAQHRKKVAGLEKQLGDLLGKVDLFVPATSCSMPAGFRVLHDAAVEGQIPDSTPRLDGAPVPAPEVARTVVTNYSACRENAERLMALQQWVREQEQLE